MTFVETFRYGINLLAVCIVSPLLVYCNLAFSLVAAEMLLLQDTQYFLLFTFGATVGFSCKAIFIYTSYCDGTASFIYIPGLAESFILLLFSVFQRRIGWLPYLWTISMAVVTPLIVLSRREGISEVVLTSSLSSLMDQLAIPLTDIETLWSVTTLLLWTAMSIPTALFCLCAFQKVRCLRRAEPTGKRREARLFFLGFLIMMALHVLVRYAYATCDVWPCHVMTLDDNNRLAVAFSSYRLADFTLLFQEGLSLLLLMICSDMTDQPPSGKKNATAPKEE